MIRWLNLLASLFRREKGDVRIVLSFETPHRRGRVDLPSIKPSDATPLVTRRYHRGGLVKPSHYITGERGPEIFKSR